MRIVLRYSDFSVDTFSEHARILEQTGTVWWAWWKKRHELFPGEQLKRFRRDLGSSTVEVGLVNRSGVYLSATCARLAMSDGHRIACPELRSTPSYYRYESFPLWLNFTALVAMTENEWSARFGAVPIGDETFFADSEGELEVASAESSGERRGRGLLHISDLHFGDDFAFSDNTQVIHRTSLEQRIADALPCSPAGVIVSGDLTTRGSNDGLVSARMFLQRLSEVLDVSRDRFVIAPGNHDVLVNDPDVTRDFENEQHFRTQMLEFYGRTTELERIHQFRGEDDIYYICVALNSSRPRDRLTMDYGYVGRDRSVPIMKKAAEIRESVSGPTWLGVVLHHHIMPAQQIEYAVPDRPVSIAIDAGELVGLAADLGFDAIMHGHEHLPFVGRTSRIAEFGGYARQQIGFERPVTVLAAGSMSVKVERLSDEMRYNSFSYYNVTPTDLHVQMYGLSAKVGPRVLQNWDFYVTRTS